jgi:4a-hydroxytetrahydrobiopterin dehydratase
MKRKKLSKKKINKLLKSREMNWNYEKGFLKKTFEFESFTAAFSFMTAVAFEAEKMNHHPNWSNVYNRVDIHLQTHDTGGVTGLDFELASLCDRAAR